MIIETEGLILRPFTEEDAYDVFEYLHEPAVHCFTSMALANIDEAKAEMKNRIGDTDFYFAIVLKKENKVIGEIFAHSESNDPDVEDSVLDTFSPCWMLNGMESLIIQFSNKLQFFTFCQLTWICSNLTRIKSRSPG